MVNHFSPASDRYPLAIMTGEVVPPIRFPAAPAGLRVLRAGLGVLHRLAPELAFRAAWRLFLTPRRFPVKTWEAAALASARATRLPFGRGSLAVYEWGSATGPLVLLVHGWEHRAAFWGVFAAELATVGYRVVALDGPAHGASVGRRTNLVEYAHALQTVSDHYGAIHAVVAHSFGAAATVALPVQFNGVGGELPRLVLLGAPGSLKAVAERFTELLHLPYTVVVRMSRHIRENFGREPDEFSLTRVGAQLRVGRALLIHDRHDEFVPFQEAEAVAAAWPALHFEPTTGLGHNKLLRDSGVIRRVVAFLG
jgi:pimeloyl-ACP methyl ester carboxylesterase